MSTYGEYMKNIHNKKVNAFFGETKKTSNKYFTFNGVIDENTIVIVTSNVKQIKDNYVLLVDNNKAVYLKNWQVACVRNYNNGIYAYAIKLNRAYFKPYTFSSNFDGFSFSEEDTFDSLMEVAKTQDMPIALGW